MKKNNTALDEKLQHYLDGVLSHDEKEAVEKLLLTDESLKEKYENLLIIDQFLRETNVVNVPGDFTERVMNRVEALPAPQRLPIRFSLIFLMVVVTVASVAVLFVSLGMFDGAVTSVDPNALPLVDQYVFKPLPTISFDGKILMEIMIFLNAAIALLVLDRAVLKPFFQRRLTRS